MSARRVWLAAPLALLACSQRVDPATPTETGGTTIMVQDNRFTPPQFALSAGSTVSWEWSGGNLHNVTFDDGPASSTQQRGQYQRRFATAGTYRYHCTIHGVAMSGTIVVLAPAPTRRRPAGLRLRAPRTRRAGSRRRAPS
jgi:plastocyanin